MSVYYLYISKSKVDMLFNQIKKEPLKGIATELSIKLPHLVDINLKKTFSQLTLFERTKIVEKYIMINKMVGGAKDLKPYIKDTLNMKWMIHPEGMIYFNHRDPDDDKENVDNYNIILGLGGSSSNLLQSCESASSPQFHSYSPTIVNTLKKKDFVGAGKNINSDALAGVELASHAIKGPAYEKFTFLAINLICSPSNDVNYRWAGSKAIKVVLGSPIYVAYYDK